MGNNIITPDYIISQIGILTIEELKDLIIEYGSQEYGDGSYWAEKSSH